MTQGTQSWFSDNLEEWDGEGEWRGREHMYTYGMILADVWQKPAQYCKAIILQ